MDQKTAYDRLCGCYITVPTMFHDDTLELNLPAIQRHVQFLLEGGAQTGSAVLLAGGAAGDFSTMTFDERRQVAETVVEAAAGRVPVTVGAQTTSTRELVELAKMAERAGAEYIQVSPPFYFKHTEEDFFEYVSAAAGAADVGIIVYNTFWTSLGVSMNLVERMVDIPNVIGLKWADGDIIGMSFERIVDTYGKRFSVIDNQLRYIPSFILGARGIEVHICNHWPEWGIQMHEMLKAGQYVEAQRELLRVCVPYYSLWREMEQYTSGDGYLDKLCMELVGLDSSCCRPPTRDVRDQFREKARAMLISVDTPRALQATPSGHS